MLTLASPLSANMPLTTVTPTQFSFFDGHQTITNLSAASSSFSFATGPTGEISEWNIVVFSGGTFGLIGTINMAQVVPNDFAQVGFGGTASNPDDPGVWSVTPAVPDAGSTLSLMTLTLMALGVAARQFKRAAA